MQPGSDEGRFRRIWGKRVIILGIGVVIVRILYGSLALYIIQNVSLYPTINSDVAIVLGAGINKNGKRNPCLLSRVNMGTKLYKSERVKKIIVSGGNDKEDGVNEAEEMKKMLLAQGVSKENILLEPTSASTYENLKNSKVVMKTNKLKSAIIVTEPFHIGRAKLIAKTLNLNTQFAASENSSCWENGFYFSHYFLKEPIAIFSYILTGKIKISALY